MQTHPSRPAIVRGILRMKVLARAWDGFGYNMDDSQSGNSCQGMARLFKGRSVDALFPKFPDQKRSLPGLPRPRY